MSKYNLSDMLNEYVGGGRIGTLNISFRDLVDRMEELEKSDEVIVREKSGPSGDGKVNREFEVVDRNSAVPGGNKQERGFTVYDYKFGFDPGDIDNYEEEYDFSVGGNDLRLAMELIDGVKPYGVREDLFSKDGGSEDNVDNIDKVASPSAKGKGYSSAIDSERSEDNKEQSDITQTTKPMYENKEKDLINAMRFHLMSHDKGIIDKDDLIQAMEELAYGDIKAPGMREDNDPSGADLEGDPDEKVMGENGDVEDYADEIKEEIAPTGIGISGDQLKDLIKLGAIAGVEVYVRDKDGKNVRTVDYTLTNTDFEKNPDDIDYIDENEGQEALKEHFNRFL